ncbi:hypothetical protein BDV25DRAFT_130646 [Aspergillus avenaceus]|uniref:Alpha/beta hydrolase fold-3 domain-containing protein n=1 Tax=Aspergillus avenaceus TaxID=36643 RepID=A0A5N6TRV2_ASPAV|nr:hypothetical protein BDV25DRAFT_130646 [Aspergillus avenaceus]
MSTLYRWFGPIYDAVLCPSLPFSIRWRLIALQPIVLLTNSIQFARSIFSSDHATTIWIPLKRAPGYSVRAIVYHPPPKISPLKPTPLHLNIHGGGFIGGLPEGNALFCQKIAAETGAIVVSTSHRYAPRHTFPTAHEDVPDVAEWLTTNSERLWGADPTLFSISGFSAGGNLALGVAQWLSLSKFAVKAAVLFYPPVDLRLPPWEKPKPARFPKTDPLAWVLPLMDAYAGPEREKYRENMLFHPILADIRLLPRRMLFVTAGIDILLHEQTVFVSRLKEESTVLNHERSLASQAGTIGQGSEYLIEDMFFDQLHGPEYHHFIPRFLLRQFAADEQPQPRSRRRPGRRGGNHRPYSNSTKDPYINVVDLKRNSLVQVPVSREFGLMDMYRDEKYPNPRHIEDKLGKLESQAARIIKKAADAFKSNDTLELARYERDVLRKFLFLMKYRSSGMFERYNHDTIEAYDANDKHRMEAYMREKGYKVPRDVWFANLQSFLDLDLDPDLLWISKVRDQAFLNDAMMFIMHMQFKFMAFCRPREEGDEFLLTHNVYGIHEGPSNVTFDPAKKRLVEGAWTDYHNFAPISPKVLIVLRSSLLINPSDEGAEELQGFWNDLRGIIKEKHNFPGESGSLLKSLPIKKCGNSYSEVINGKFVLKPNRGPRSGDKFYFTCFSISSYHVNLINGLFLEEAVKADILVYKSRLALGRALKAYLEDDRKGFKIVINDPSDPRIIYLRKLEKIAGQVVGKANTRYNAIDLPKPGVHMSHYVGLKVGLGMIENSGKDQAEVPELYKLMKPDGTKEAYFYDMYQSGAMAFMKIKLDVILARSRLTHYERLEVKFHLQQLFMQLPAQRVWLYLKIMRNLPNFDPKDFKKQVSELEIAGPEDDVVTSEFKSSWIIKCILN